MKNMGLKALIFAVFLTFSPAFGAETKPGVIRPDGSTLELNGSQIRVKDSGITSAKILDATIATADLADGAVTNSKRGAVNRVCVTADNAGLAGTSVNTSYTNVHSTGATITTSGHPVLISVEYAGVSTNPCTQASSLSIPAGEWAEATVNYRLFRDGGALATYREKALPMYNFGGSGINSTATFNCSFVFTDSPAAGTYTYNIGANFSVWRRNSTYTYNFVAGTMYFYGMRICATEQ